MLTTRLEKLTLISTLWLMLIHALGIYAGFYVKYTNFDVLVHLSGGFWLGCAVLLFLNRFPVLNIQGNKVAKLITLGGLVLILCLGWEFFELALTKVANGMGIDLVLQPSIQDTLADMFNGMVGAIVAGYFSKKI